MALTGHSQGEGFGKVVTLTRIFALLKSDLSLRERLKSLEFQYVG